MQQNNNNQRSDTSKRENKKKDQSFSKDQSSMRLSTEGSRSLEVDEDSIKLTVVDDINVYLLHLELEQTVCFRILLYVAKRLEIDTEALKSLTGILQKKKDAEIFRKVNDRRLANIQKFDKYGKLYGLSLALDYLSYNDRLENLLLVNKKCKNFLEKKVYKIILSQPDEKLKPAVRLQIWKNISRFNQFQLDYQDVKSKHQLETKPKSSLDEIIALDIHRSFHNHSQINKQVLNDLLRLYAQHDKHISYCQGMNYLMGFFYSLFKEEATTFKFFTLVINKYMRSLFENDLQKLQLLFYQFDRLVSIFLPRLSEHFKREGIETSHFSPSWFITVFTTVFQLSNKSYFLFRIWDSYLLDGWKGLFKTCIYILDLQKSNLMKKRFDQVISILNESTSLELFTNFKYNEHVEKVKSHPGMKFEPSPEEIPIREFVQKVNEINITDQLLKQLVEEYIDKSLKG